MTLLSAFKHQCPVQMQLIHFLIDLFAKSDVKGGVAAAWFITCAEVSHALLTVLLEVDLHVQQPTLLNIH